LIQLLDPLNFEEQEWFVENSSLPAWTIRQPVVDISHASTRSREAANIPSEWLTAAEAAQYLKIKVRTLLLWARQGKVKGHVLSGTQRHVWRFRREDLDAAFLQPAGYVLHSPLSSVRSAEKEAAR
jgi:excisionase family DNA binding protein